MKKVLFISLLLVAVFLIGSSGVAVGASCIDYQDYSCKVYVYKEGGLVKTVPDCVKLCYEAFGVTINDSFGKDLFNGTLYPALDDEDLLGTYNSVPGMGGCSVEFPSRRSINVRLAAIQQDSGFVYVFRCAECDNCCSP